MPQPRLINNSYNIIYCKEISYIFICRIVRTIASVIHRIENKVGAKGFNNNQIREFPMQILHHRFNSPLQSSVYSTTNMLFCIVKLLVKLIKAHGRLSMNLFSP